MEAYTKPTFTEQEIEKFEKFIDSQISKGYQQIRLSTGIVSNEMARLQTYLGFYYPSGSFSPNANFRNYRVAKNGKKYTKKENW
jgi:hypothetical protein